MARFPGRNFARGRILEQPKEILLGHSGETVFANVLIQNDLKKKYLKGTHLVSIFDHKLMPYVEEVKIPLE